MPSGREGPPLYPKLHPVTWGIFHASSGHLAFAQIGGRLEKPIRLLLIEEDPGERAAILASLRGEFPHAEALEISDPGSLRAALSLFQFDLAVMEYQLSWSTGLDIFPRIRQFSPGCPCILFAGTGNEEAAVQALKSGFDDYILKSPRNLPRLSASARLAVERARERRRAGAVDFRMEDLLARLNVGVCRARLNGTILYANPAFRRLFRKPPAPAPLPPLFALLPYSGSAGEGGVDALLAGTPRLSEACVPGPGGESRWFCVTESLATIPRFLDDSASDGSTDAAEAVVDLLVEDITERKRLDLRLREQEEATRQLRNLESVGRLAGGVAHDFNNMLMAINGYSELLLATMDERNPLRSLLAEIHLAGKRAAGLTRDLLAFSGRQILAAGRLDLNLLLAGMAAEVRRTLGEGIRLELDLHPEPQPVYCDGEQLRLALMNLVANARDAMPSGGLLLIATTPRCLKEQPGISGRGSREGARSGSGLRPGQYVVLTLADTGIGMDAALQDRIFEPFFTDKPMATRSGMGLAAAYGIVRQSGGEIGVESEPGQGTCFRIWLPRSGTAQARPDAQAGPEQAGPEMGGFGKGRVSQGT
jgi:signal transduction histidine kinase